eukprot:93895-Chlamydomonas_euryale.AAC.3
MPWVWSQEEGVWSQEEGVCGARRRGCVEPGGGGVERWVAECVEWWVAECAGGTMNARGIRQRSTPGLRGVWSAASECDCVCGQLLPGRPTHRHCDALAHACEACSLARLFRSQSDHTLITL